MRRLTLLVAAVLLMIPARGRRGGRSPALDADGHVVAPARLLAGRDRRPAGQSVLRRHRLRPLPHRPGAARDRPQGRRDPGLRADGRGLQPHRRHLLGRERGRAPAAAARVLLPGRAQRRQHVPDRLDRRRRPAIPAVALLREARPHRDPEGDVERGVARRRAGLDLQRRRPARLPEHRRRAGERGARRGRRSTPCGAWSTPSRRAASPAPRSSAAGCSSPDRPAGRSGSGRSTSRRARGGSRPSARSSESRRAWRRRA